MIQLTDFSNLSVVKLECFKVYRDENNSFVRRPGRPQAQQLLNVLDFRLRFVTHAHDFVCSIGVGLNRMEGCYHCVATMCPEGPLYECGLPLMSWDESREVTGG